MEDCFAALEQAFEMYRQDLDEYERKRKPTDGLLGFGHSLKDDPCHERFDDRVKEAAEQLCASQPEAEDAERFIRRLLPPREAVSVWPVAAQWMLCAIERHTLLLIPFLSGEAAAAIRREYAARYKRWERLPVQQQVLKALQDRAAGK